MNTRPPLFKPAGPGSLADEPDFALAHLSVRPSIREVSSGERRETLEPRMMQVLVVLAHADGAVVSRDELIRQCWGGRAVSDDAVNRAISKLRQLGTFDAREAFTIETIARVGYRLICSRTGQKPAFPGIAPPAAASQMPDTPDTANAPAHTRRVSWAVLAAAAAAIATTAAAVFFGLSSFAPRPAALWVVAEAHQPFIATPAQERFPAISPNGAMIAYAAGPDREHLSLYVKLLTGGDPKRLTTGDTAYAPAWSPDGGRIAYVSNAPGQTCRIMLIDALGGTPREAGRCRYSVSSSLAWSGDSLLYSDGTTRDVPSAIYRLDLASGSITQISRPVPGAFSGDYSPVVSPDGKTLAFTRPIQWFKAHVIVHDLATGAERVLLDSKDDGVSTAWSADSKTLFIARNTKWDAGLWAYPVSGAPPQRITTSPIPLGGLSSGPDGQLAMELYRSEGDLADAATSPGQPSAEFAKDGYDMFFHAYAPDGTLAVIARQSGALSLFLAGPDKVLHKLLPLQGDAAAGIAWSPDSSKLAFIESGPSDGAIAIDLVERSGLLKRLPFQATDTGWIDWSDDGKSLLVTHLDKQGWRYWRIDLAHTDKPVLLPLRGWMNIRTHAGMLFGVKDGAKDSDKGIWRLDDGAPRRLTNWPIAGEGGDSWTLSGDSVVYLDMSDPARLLFKAQPMRGGPARTIGYPQGVYGDDIFAVDPATKLVTFQHRVASDSDIGWMRVTRK